VNHDPFGQKKAAMMNAGDSAGLRDLLANSRTLLAYIPDRALLRRARFRVRAAGHLSRGQHHVTHSVRRPSR
jgi:hypothetical protein